MTNSGDAILLLSFGGPDRPEEVMPFLENVLRGRNVPRERHAGSGRSTTTTSAGAAPSTIRIAR